MSSLNEKDPSKHTLVLTGKGQEYLIKFADIKYIIADGSYTHIHTDKRNFVSTKSLKEFEHILPATFFYRIHHGHIINKHYIVTIQKGRGGVVSMTDGKSFAIAVRRKEGFLKMYGK